jgi:hypothetical protein
MGPLLEHVRSYYQALNSGDPGRVAEHFTDDAVHYYTRLGPHEGARVVIASFCIRLRRRGDSPTMTWRDPKSGEPHLDRGASGDLLGFDHAGRGHATL